MRLGQDHPEPPARRGILRDRQAYTLTRGCIEIIQNAACIDLAAHHGPGFVSQLFSRIARDGRRAREAMQQAREPLGAGVRVVALGLRKIERQIVGHDAMLDAAFASRDLEMSLG